MSGWREQASITALYLEDTENLAEQLLTLASRKRQALVKAPLQLYPPEMSPLHGDIVASVWPVIAHI